MMINTTLHRRQLLKAILLTGPVILAACGKAPSTPVATVAPTIVPVAPAPTATPDPLWIKVESFARITLPTSASDLHAEFMANGNNTTVVKFSIPANDLALTLQQAGYVNGIGGLKDGSSSLQAHKDLPWWQLRQASAYAGDVATEPGFVRRVVVDKSDPNRYVIYLEHLEV